MTTPTSTTGRMIGGRYVLRSTVGSGGMGTVWRAYDEVLRREVAVKEVLLPPGVPAAERAMLCERTLREARAAASLNTASVVTIYDVVEEDGRPWIIMALLDARSLAEIVRDDGPLPPAVVAEVGLQVLGALDAAHSARILHRDVKPGNVLLSRDGRATLTDFGVARTVGDSPLTSTGMLLGSPAYISPERARGHQPGPASDLWALGATLYAAVEGRPPFDAGEPMATLTSIVSDPPRPATLAGPLAPVLAGMLEKNPALRSDVVRATTGLRTALEDLDLPVLADRRPPTRPRADHTQVIELRPPALSRPPAARRRRRRGRVVAGLVVLALLGAGIGYVALAGVVRLPGHRPNTGHATGHPSRSRPPIPAGFVRYDDPSGMSVGIPAGWKKETTPGNYVQFRDRQHPGTFLRLQVTSSGGHDLHALWAAADQNAQRRLKGYGLVGYNPAKVAGRDGEDWEFTHAQEGHPRQVVDRGVEKDGKVYAFYLSTNQEDFATTRSLIDTVTATVWLP